MKNRFLATLALAALMMACHKDDVTAIRPTVVEPASFAGLTTRYAPPVQVFEFDPTVAQTFTSSGGARLEMQANSFVGTDGTAPTGRAVLHFQEIYSPAEMILAERLTMMGFHRGLESGGEFNVSLNEKVTGRPLRLSVRDGVSSRKLRLQSPVPTRVLNSPALTRMIEWTPSVSNPSFWVEIDTLSLDGSNGHSANPLGTLPVPFVPNTGGANGSFITSFWPNQLGWLNIDTYYPFGTQTVWVFLQTEAGGDETRMFFVPTGINGAFQPVSTPTNNLAMLENIPLGAELTAVVIRVQDGKYFFGTQKARVTPSIVYRPVLEQVSEEELVRRLRLL